MSIGSAAQAPAPGGPRFCRRCGAALRPGSRFCQHCGAEVGAARLPGEAPAPGATGAPAVPVAPSPGPAGGAPAPPVGAGYGGPQQYGPGPQYAPSQQYGPAQQYGAPQQYGATQYGATRYGATAAGGQAAPPQWPRGSMVLGQVAAGRPRKSWFSSLPPLVKLGALFLGLVFIGAVIQGTRPSAPTCAYSCVAPPTGPVQASGKSYSGSLFSFDYPSTMSVQQPPQFGATVMLNDPAGLVLVFGGQGAQTPSGLVQEFQSKIPSGVQQVAALGPIYGAEIGFVPGSGEFYSGVLQSQNGQDEPIGVGIIAAASGNTWAVVMVGAPCFDHDNGQQVSCTEAGLTSQGQQIGNSFSYDDILGRWHWAS